MPIRSGKSLFARKVPTEKLKKLDDLYNGYEPLAEEYNKLVNESRVIEKQIAEFNKWKDSYENQEHYKNIIEGLGELLSKIQEKINNSTFSKSFQKAADAIIAYEIEIFGEAKLPSITELDSLYSARIAMIDKNHQLIEKRKKLQDQLVIFKPFETHSEEYANAIKEMEKDLETTENDVMLTELELTIHDVEITSLEKEAYGESKLPFIDKLAELYVIHNAYNARHAKLLEDVKAAEQELVKAKESNDYLEDESEFITRVKALEEKFEVAQTEFRNSTFKISLADTDQEIIEIETELYGKPKLSLAPANMKPTSSS
ncbi:MAG: hypothetical protein V4501_11465 [Pseudomonadota bacterium]